MWYLKALGYKKTILLMVVKKMSREMVALIDNILQGDNLWKPVKLPKMSGKEFGFFIDGLRAARLAKAK